MNNNRGGESISPPFTKTKIMAKGPFKLRSGNTTPFKMMGSSPLKQVVEEEEVVTEDIAAEVEIPTVEISEEGRLSGE